MKQKVYKSFMRFHPMVLTDEQIHELKKQLVTQVQHLPHNQKEEALQQIDEMSPETLELMLNQQRGGKSDKTILRSIVEGSIPSKKVDENKYALAVVDIRPVSKGHVLIIPRQAVEMHEQLPTQIFTLAKKIAKRIKTKLKPKGTEIQTETKFEEQVLNVIPYYDKPLSVTSPRYEASQEELETIQKLIAAKARKPRIKKKSLAPTPQKTEYRPIIVKRRIP